MEHTMVDTTFIPTPNQVALNKYRSLIPEIIDIDGNNVYILGTCDSYEIFKEGGFVMDKLDIHTGKRFWSHHNTPYNGGHLDLYHNLSFATKGKIEMVGAEDDGVKKLIYPVYKAIDSETGKLLKYKRTNIELIRIYSRYYTGWVIHPDSIYVNAYTIGEAIDLDFADYGMNIDMLDKDMQSISHTRHLFDFTDLGLVSVDQTNYTKLLNKNTLIALAYRDRYESIENLGTKIMWVDISDSRNVKLKQIRDYADIVPGTQRTPLLQSFNTINNTICLTHNYYNRDIERYIGYILWLDSLGDIKTFVPIPKRDNHFYELTDMFYANDTFAYLFAYPSSTGRAGCDIIRIETGIDTCRFISSITATNADENFGTLARALYNQEYLLIGGRTSKKNQALKTAFKTYCFRTSDLGLDFKLTTTKDTEVSEASFSIFPNPVANTLYLKYTDTYGKMDILDINGRVVHQSSLNQNYNIIDIANLNAGIYYVRVTGQLGVQIGKTEKLIKIE